MLGVRCMMYECVIMQYLLSNLTPHMYGSNFLVTNADVHRTSNIVPVKLYFLRSFVFPFPPFTFLYLFLCIGFAFGLSIHHRN